MVREAQHGLPVYLNNEYVNTHDVIEALSPFLSEQRKLKMERVLEGRTYAVVPVLDQIFDRGNMSAVLRTTEALGFQSVHVVESPTVSNTVNRATQGADKWLTLSRWKSPAKCLSELRDLGYSIAVTDLSKDAIPIHEVPLDQPLAIVFGNESKGASQEFLDAADYRFYYPMSGFTQSFNISVAAATCLSWIAERRREALGHEGGYHGDLTVEQKTVLRALFYLKSVDRAEILVREHLKKNQQKHAVLRVLSSDTISS